MIHTQILPEIIDNSELIENFDQKNIEKKETKTGKVQFETEMKIGLISKGKVAKETTHQDQKKKQAETVTKVKTIVKKFNEKGQRLTKKGEIDKRSETSAINIKTSRYKALLAEKKPKRTAYVESDESDESDLEFTIETIEPTEPVVPKSTPFIEKELEKRKKMDDEMFNLTEENKKLKQGLIFNNHLQSIDRMSRTVQMRFS